ncbi:MAG: UDP-N-acetylmuramoyl-L-alanyl-D-glutamate--2,6-diaminopimelate ligase [Desulfomicrobiaceae bacterium]|nr:UDP-N-acetylmuramoyl-L-alanyl-D-glutamate--2,6-diaminopimelate ligase [Desulfomicrobiaceae bacterium]
MDDLRQIEDLVRRGARLCSHSGQVTAGDVFIALPGTHVDGARFVPDAVSRGAVAVVTARGVAVPAGVLHAEVENPAQTLGELARIAYGGAGYPCVVGITGTNGKTTTTYLVEAILAASGRKVGVVGTVACRWPGNEAPSSMTTPDVLTLHQTLGRMARDGVDTVVLEVSSHALHQNRLAGIAVEIGVFTNLTQDHLDYHHTMEEYFAAKALLFHAQGKACRLAAINADDPWGRRLAQSRPDAVTFGLAEHADVRGCVQRMDLTGMRLAMTWQGRRWEVASPLVGAYNAQNLLAAQTVGLLLGLDPNTFAVALEHAGGAPGRLERVPHPRGVHVFVDYAHTPDALDKVCATLRAVGKGRLIVVFGCGGDRDPGKRPLMGEAVARHAHVAVVTSDNPRSEDPEAIIDAVMPGLAQAPRVLRESDRRTAIALALAEARPGDAVLIAGKGHESVQIIGQRRLPFSDVAVARELAACA